MPTYTFRKASGEEFTEFMTISEMEQFMKDNPDVQQVPGMFSMTDPWHRKKPDSAFRDLLKNVQKKNGKNAATSSW